MMTGEVNFDDLYYPFKMVIQPSKLINPDRPFPDIGTNFTLKIQNFEQMPGNLKLSNISEYVLPNLFNADVNTSPKPPFYPGTGTILVAVFIYLVPVVMFNLLVGLAIDDVQVIDKNILMSYYILHHCILKYILKYYLIDRNSRKLPKTFS